MKGRLKILGLAFFIGAIAILGRLFYWQVIKAGELSDWARSQQRGGERILASRGSILDRNGDWLVTSRESWLMYAEKPKFERNPKWIANQIGPILMREYLKEEEYKQMLLDEVVRIEQLLRKEGAVWVPIRHKVSTQVKEEIEELEISGLGFEEEEERFYPEASIAAHTLGFVGKDEDGEDKGYFGLEGFYDLSLTGKPGFEQGEWDAKGSPIIFGESKEIAAVGGVDLQLYLDKSIQLIVEEKLAEGIEKYGASAGTVVVMDPSTGGILAMASSPGYDPAEYWEYNDELFRNRAISDSFEPGSVFKPIVMASALDAKEVEPDTKCEICSGPVKVDKYEIGTWNDEYRADATMTEVIVHSDNVGMVYVGNKLGKERMYDYLEKFGFGSLTGVDLQGEATPQMREKGTWNVVDLATASFGQGIAATPLQLVRAIATIANGGKMVHPRLVSDVRVDGYTEDVSVKHGERVISKKAATEITEMMRQAVEEGESKWVQARGFDVAGKTGTAQIPVKGHYDEEKTIASFVGFAPAEKPKFVMLVTLREPESSPWASETAAPLWFSISRELFPYLGIQPKK